jgi:hypothetical protein
MLKRFENAVGRRVAGLDSREDWPLWRSPGHAVRHVAVVAAPCPELGGLIDYLAENQIRV